MNEEITCYLLCYMNLVNMCYHLPYKNSKSHVILNMNTNIVCYPLLYMYANTAGKLSGTIIMFSKYIVCNCMHSRLKQNGGKIHFYPNN